MTYEESVISALDDVGKYFRRLCHEEADTETYAKYYSMMSIVSQASNLIEELMEKQEPRVLTLDEVKAIGTQNFNQMRDENTRLVWVEEESALNIAKPTYYDLGLEDNEEEPIYLYYVGTDFFDRCDTSTYGKDWRCWSTKPTEEQRESVKWAG